MFLVENEINEYTILLSDQYLTMAGFYTRRFLCAWVIVTSCVATPMVTNNTSNGTGHPILSADTTLTTAKLMTSSDNVDQQPATSEDVTLTSQIPHSTSDGFLPTVNASLNSSDSGKRPDVLTTV